MPSASFPMAKTSVIVASFAALLVSSGQADGQMLRSKSTVELEIAVGNTRGRVLCGVYQRSGWLRRPVKGTASAIRGKVATCRFQDLDPGTYAAGAFQDQNLNGHLDRNWTGMPAEPWSVSRESRGTLGPPSFEAASFAVSPGTVHVRCRAR